MGDDRGDSEVTVDALGRAERRRQPQPNRATPAGEQATTTYWLNHMWAGAAMYVAGIGIGAAYLQSAPDGPNRSLLWWLVGVGAVSVVLIIAGPRRAIARSRHRLVFFVGWSLFSVAFTAIIAAYDDGLESPLALLMLLPMLYAALAYPVAYVAGIAAAAIMAATGVAIANEDPVRIALPFIGVLGMVGSVSTFAASQRERQDAHLVNLATHDGLTGCLDHGAFYGRLEKELAMRPRSEVGLVLIDVDDFKAINDRHGHLAGDDVLRTVGTALRAVTRSSDAVGRVGGDEFGLIFVDPPSWVREEVGQRIAGELTKHELPCKVTISVGVASAGPYRQVGIHDLVAEADVDLYEAKKTRPKLRSVN